MVFSSRSIPGNEKSIADVVSICAKDDVEIITPNMHNIHVSGHAYRGDIELFLEHIKPKFHLPVHGTFTQLKSNQKSLLKTLTPWRMELSGKFLMMELSYVGRIDPKMLFVDSWSRLTHGLPYDAT